jgi:hypothetical protein
MTERASVNAMIPAAEMVRALSAARERSRLIEK